MPLLNPALKGFYETPNKRNYVLHGGRSSSKTVHTAGFAVMLACEYQVKFLCTRQFQNRIGDSVKTEIELAIETAGLNDEFRITEYEIEHKFTGSLFIFYGIQRNIKEIKGVSGVDVLWIEEGELLTEEQWNTLTATVRSASSRIWIVFNPRLITDFVWQRLVVDPPADTIIRQINYLENPYLSNTALKMIADMKARDFELYQHIYLGMPLADNEQAIIKRSWIESAIDAHIKLGFEITGPDKIGFDVADDGGDMCANIHTKGSVALWGEEWKAREDELLKSCGRTYANASSRNAHIYYDSIGVGAMAGAKFDEINQQNGGRLQYTKFNAGGAVANPDQYYAFVGQIKNKDYFCNLKSQTWWGVADRFRNTYNAVTNGVKYPVDELISISSAMPHLEKLKTELSTPIRDFDNNGKVKVESKKDLAKRDVKSPNLADAFVMCFSPERSRGFFG